MKWLCIILAGIVCGGCGIVREVGKARQATIGELRKAYYDPYGTGEPIPQHTYDPHQANRDAQTQWKLDQMRHQQDWEWVQGQ
jgi:hypothetical protein